MHLHIISAFKNGSQDSQSVFMSEEVTELQTSLFELSNENMAQTVAFFFASDWFSTPEKVHQFIETVLLAYAIRGVKMPLYISLFVNLLREYDGELIRTGILDAVFRVSVDNVSFRTNALRFLFVRQCMEAEILSESEVVGRIADYMNRILQPEPYYTSLMFCYFAAELERANPELYMKMREILHSDCTSVSAPIDLLKFWKTISKETDDDDFLLRHFDWDGRTQLELASVEEFFIRDDPVGLSDYLRARDFDVNEILVGSLFYGHPTLQYGCKLVHAAVYFGAINCFKYLMLNGAILEYKDDANRSTLGFAVAGGNLEILRLLWGLTPDLETVLETAAQCHRMEIFTWALDLLPSDSFAIIQNTFTTCAGTSSIAAMRLCLENGADINRTDSSGFLYHSYGQLYTTLPDEMHVIVFAFSCLFLVSIQTSLIVQMFALIFMKYLFTRPLFLEVLKLFVYSCHMRV